VYEWTEDSTGKKINRYTRLADVSVSEGRITWGSLPKLTFRLSPDGRTLDGEWEAEGDVSLVTMKKIALQSTGVDSSASLEPRSEASRGLWTLK
jgi:hypothetical protein